MIDQQNAQCTKVKLSSGTKGTGQLKIEINFEGLIS